MKRTVNIANTRLTTAAHCCCLLDTSTRQVVWQLAGLAGRPGPGQLCEGKGGGGQVVTPQSRALCAGRLARQVE